MRLDLFLKSSRLIQRRTLAQEFCDAGLISVNGTPAKSSKDVHSGDEITIKRRSRVTSVRVNSIPQSKQVAKSQAAELYEVLSDVVRPEPDPLT
jgi:ribosomal 50S subunit-recycling heat shock protein